MSTITTNYNYYVNLSYVNGSEVQKIDPAAIQTLVISREFESTIAPTALLDIKLDVALYNKMVKNKNTAKILLEIKKFDKDAVSKVGKDVIKKQLSYLLQKDAYEYSEGGEGYEHSYKLLTIGLFDSDAANNDRRIINGLYRGTNMMTMVANELNAFKLIIEPFDNNKSFNTFYILPQEGVHKFLDYMNKRCAFYKTNYRFFQDWNGYTYLLSNKGKGIDIGDGMYTTVKIQLSTDEEFGGIISDTDQRIYTIRCSDETYVHYQNTVTDNIVNQVYAVTSDGSKSKNNLNINKASGSKAKPKVIRVSDNNTAYANAVGNALELSSDMLNIIVCNTDISVLVPYKEFIIKNKSELSDRDGKYILTCSKEIFTPDSGHFRSDVVAAFKKVKS